LVVEVEAEEDEEEEVEVEVEAEAEAVGWARTGKCAAAAAVAAAAAAAAVKDVDAPVTSLKQEKAPAEPVVGAEAAECRMVPRHPPPSPIPQRRTHPPPEVRE
jgi:hypothetical protein